MSKSMPRSIVVFCCLGLLLAGPALRSTAPSPPPPGVNPLPPEVYGTSCTLTWRAPVDETGAPVPGIAGYVVQSGTDPTFATAETADAGDATSYTKNDLAMCSTYYFRVYAKDVDGNPQNLDPYDPDTNPHGVRWSCIIRTKCAAPPAIGGPAAPAIQAITPPDPPNLYNNTYYLNDRNPAVRWTASDPVPVPFKAVVGGDDHTIGLKADGTVWAWGYNLRGQLGDGTNVNRTAPVQVKDGSGTGFLTGVIALSGGRMHTVALKEDGTVWAWGANNVCQLGNGATADSWLPVQVRTAGGFLTDIVAISAGLYHNVALKNDGSVWTWGYNLDGQLGIGTSGSGTHSSVAVQPKGLNGAGLLTGVVSVAAGGYHNLALRPDGTVYAWGFNGFGQLGNGTTTNSSVPIQVRGAYGAGYLNGVSAIGGGRYVSMAVMASGLAHTWGYNDCGQLGIGSAIIQSAYPRQAINLTDVSAINGGWSHTAALKKDGTAWCWGDNDYGQLGNNTTTDAYAPVQVKGPGGAGFLSGLAGLDAGRYHNAALKSDGTVWTWGYNYYGQLGDTTTANRYVPVAAQCPVTYSSAQIKAQVSIAEMPDVARAFNEYPVFEVATPDLQALTNWNLPDGRYVVHVRAANNVSWSPWSAGAPLIVDATPPTVSLDTVTVGQDGVLNAAASAADNLAGVAKVVFQANGIIVEDAAAPYTADWDTAGWPGTVHTVTAQAFDRAGNPSTVASADISLDKAPPVTAHDYQHDGEWVNTPVTIVFTATDVGSGVAGTYYRINGGADQSGSVLNLEADGEYTVEFWSVDCANNTETPPKTVSVKIDRTPPVITAEVTPPPNAAGWHDADATVTFSAADALSGVLSLSPQTATVSAEGAGQQVTAEAVDSAGNTATHTVTINLDRTPPIVASLQPLDGCWISTQRPTIEVVVDDVSGIATYTLVLDGAPVTSGVIVNGNRLQYMPDYDLSTAAPHAVQVQVTDRVGLSSATVSSTFRIDPAMPPLPPDPKEVAPPLDSTVFTDLASATSFLYTEENPIQTGVAPGTIEPARAAVLRGRVLGADGFALPGVTVSVLGHPEYGQTVSRVDGLFDLAVNGGGVLTLRYERPGYLPAQRQVDAPWQDYVQLPDVALKQLDSQVTTVDLSQTGGQVARGSVVTDADGTRQATLFFPEGVQAAGYPSTLHIRATEYTVGENGPKAMPAELPPTVAYTYCVELSADEAAGGSVQFDRPVYFYVENFLNFPVGTEVPAGYYDYAKAAWIPSKDGRVIRILGATEGLAEVDVSGTGRPADAATLAGLGFTDAERRRLAETYNPGQSIWRVPVSHFSPWDFNWPFGPPPGAKGPQLAKAAKVCGREDNSCLEEQRSTIEIQNQILRETIGIAGTPYTLNYASDRTAGRKAEYSVKIPLSDDQPPPGLKRIDLEVRIAGRTFAETFAPLPNQAHIFTWDGRDVYGRELQGMQPAKVRIGYTYDAVYYSTQNALENSFGTVSGVPITGSRARQEVTLWEEYETLLGTWQARAYGLGGWTLDVQHFYDPSGRVLYLGDGSRRSAGNISSLITTIAGTGQQGYYGDGRPATEAMLYYPDGVVIAPDGSIMICDCWNHRIRRIDRDGIITTIAGSSGAGYGGDGGPAQLANLNYPQGLAIGPDGSIYIADCTNHRIRRIGPDGIMTTVAGNGQNNYGGDGGPATAAMLDHPRGVAVGSDGSIYIADCDDDRIRRVTPDGIITTIAGTGQRGYGGDGGPAIMAQLAYPCGIDVGPDGSVYIVDCFNNRIRRIGPDGIITTVAGTGQYGYGGDGGPATAARLAHPWGQITVGSDGVYFADSENSRIRRIGPDGIITTVAGTGQWNYGGDNGPATAAHLRGPQGVTVGPDRSIYIADMWNHRIRRVSPVLPGFTPGEYAIPSKDGSQIYRFDATGRHLSTINALTGTPVYIFHYNEAKLLHSVEDADGNLTVIERDTAGNPTAIVGPYGQRTSLTVDASGMLKRVVNQAGEAADLGYNEDGLLTTLVDPRGGLHSFNYDVMGRLIRDEDPAGGATSLEWVELANGYMVRKREKVDESTENVTTYQVENLSTGERRLTNQGCCGGPIVSVVSPNGTTTTTHPDGTVTTTVEGPDPRFGMQAPITKSMTVKTPSGLIYTQTAERTVTLAVPGDPLSLQTLTDTVTINGRTYTSVYDAATHRITSTTPEGRQSFTTLDAKGRVILVEVPGLAPTSFAYDARGRLETITEGTGINARVNTIRYNAQGYVESATDPLNRTTSFEYDLAGRVTAQIRPDGRRIPFTYDEHGNVTSITPPGKPAHTFTYTPVDLEDVYTPPPVAGSGTNVTDHDYNLNRQLVQVTRPDGQTIGFAYDTMGRLDTVTVPGGEIGYIYDATTGNLKNIITVDGGALTYGYDGSLLTKVTWAGTVACSVGYGYDNSFRLTSLKINDTNPVAYQYDQDDLLTQVGAMILTRNAQNGMLSGTIIGNVTDNYTYNTFGENTDYAAQYTGVDIYRVHQELDKLGRITSKTETVDGQTHIFEYTYDLAGRLTDVRKDGTPIGHYDYDDNGNRLGYTGGGSSVTGTYDYQDRLLSYGGNTYEYTANGELLNKTDSNGTTSYVYDLLGNLISVTLSDGTQIQYLIDGQNRRVGKKVNGLLVQGFLYQDGLEPVAELDGNGNVKARFVYGTRANIPDYMIKGGVTYRIISDYLGSPRLIIDVDTGQIAQRMDYDEFGNVTLDTNPEFQPFGFAGGIYDRHTGLVRFGVRDYDAEIGRWLLKEPIRFLGGNNLYKYCGNNPINWIDINGLHPQWFRDLYWIPFFGWGATLGEGLAHTFWDDGEYHDWCEWQSRMYMATLSTVTFGMGMVAMGYTGNEVIIGPTAAPSGPVGRPFDPNGSKIQIGVDPKTLKPNQDLSAISDRTVRDAVRYAGDKALEVNPQGYVLDGNARLKDALATGRAVDVVITNQATKY